MKSIYNYPIVPEDSEQHRVKKEMKMAAISKHTNEEDSQAVFLNDFPIPHGNIKKLSIRNLRTTINSQTAVCYMRFFRPVCIEHLELPLSVYGRWIPSAPVHPAHLIVSVLDSNNFCWKKICEVDLPINEKILGKNLS